MILDGFYLTLIGFAIITIQTRVLRNAVIYLSVFSLLCSVVYLFLGAPDVAIAEAVIGCTLSTILYLVALKKYRIFTVYYRCLSTNFDELSELKSEKAQMKIVLTKFATMQELQLDLINTTSSYRQIANSSSYDVIVFHSTRGLWLLGLKNSYQYEELTKYFNANLDLPIHINYMKEDNLLNVVGKGHREKGD